MLPISNDKCQPNISVHVSCNATREHHTPLNTPVQVKPGSGPTTGTTNAKPSAYWPIDVVEEGNCSCLCEMNEKNYFKLRKQKFIHGLLIRDEPSRYISVKRRH